MAISTCGLAAVFTIFCSISLAGIFIPIIHSTAGFIAVETAVRALIVLLLAFMSYLVVELARHDRIILRDEGMSFPLFLAPDLLFRRHRKWDDIGNILLGAMLLQDKKGTYEYELEAARDKKKLFIYFRSGGHAALDLTKMPRQSVEKLFQSVESWCIACTRTPPAGRITVKEKQKVKEKEPVPLSYTQMWEEELQAHFSATNFVPIEKGCELQDGRYSVIMQLSAGGFSAIYLAETPNKELVVLKEAALPRSLPSASRTKAKELFSREATILQKLQHPKLARLIDSFVERGRDYLVLQFIAGENLRQIVKRHGTQSEQTTLKVALQCAEMLQYLHSQEPPVIHRDLTPDNVILKDNEDVFIIDFGAANEFVGAATGTMVGKQCYIAPEQFRGKASPQSDLYALGGTLYFLLTGQDPEALTASHPRAQRPDISDEVDALVGALTAMPLEERIESAADVIKRVQQLISDTVLSLNSRGAHDG